MVKVLFAGDVGGKVEALFKRVSAVNSSAAGPFDVLLCTGGLFESTGEHILLKVMMSSQGQGKGGPSKARTRCASQ